MTSLVPIDPPTVPELAAAGARGSMRFHRLGQCGKPGYQSRFEPTTGPLETFVTLAAIQRLART